MPKFSANLSMLFKEVDFLDRFELAARAGFKAVEFLFPYEWEKAELQQRLRANGLEVVLHNLPAGDWNAGERGLACLPDRVSEFRDGVARALDYAMALGCPRLNCLAGILPAALSAEEARQTLVANARYAAGEAQKAGAKLLVEAINTRDMPGFGLSTTEQALQVLAAVNHPNLYVQYDIYHMHIMGDDLKKTIAQNVARIAHMQLADAPGRHEPGTGEIGFDDLFSAIDATGYDGWIGCEYNPTGLTEASLGWVRKYL